MRLSQKKKILVAMSGGVDSSVAAALLKSEGHEVIGIHLQLCDQTIPIGDRFKGRCCSVVDPSLVQRVCDQIDIPYYPVNAQEMFKDKVVDYFVHEYLQNRTPNPCVQCNNQIKFHYLFQKASELGCDWVATGHCAQVFHDSQSGMAYLRKSVDSHRDQTYFLFGLTQKELQRILMPLGGFTQIMVGKLAEEFGLSLVQGSDNQEVCFIHEEGYEQFIEKRSPRALRPIGMIRTLDGAVVGEHEGLYQYTMGQKKGIQIRVKDPEKYFVVGFDSRSQVLIVGHEKDLFHKELMATQTNWIRPVNELHGIRCKARIRPRHEEALCRVTCFEGGRVQVEFDEAQRAIMPGQAIVFYQEDEALGGAFIERVGARPGVI